MKVVIDIETDSLRNPNKIWTIVCKELDKDNLEVFNNPDINSSSFIKYSQQVTHWIGHNFIQFDARELKRLIPDVSLNLEDISDTLIACRTINYTYGNSLNEWGERFKYPKDTFNDFNRWSQQLVDRCKQDVLLTERLYLWLQRWWLNDDWKEAIDLEHKVQVICEAIKDNGFRFNFEEGLKLHASLYEENKVLETSLQKAFPPQPKFIREVTPKETKQGTLSKVGLKWCSETDLEFITPNITFSRVSWESFNPGSPKQVVERLNKAGWCPTEKTKGYINALRSKEKDKLEYYKKYGWKVSEENLTTLPADAPVEAHSLVKWLLINGRIKRLEEYFKAYNLTTERIHGTFNGIGTWTHRKSHKNPNMGNVPSLYSKYNGKELKDLGFSLGKQIRSLWIADKDSVLVGTDASGIQMRIFAHYVNDEELINAIINGNTEAGTDIHNLHYKKLSPFCTSRADSKTFIYAWLLGAGLGKIASIFGCGYKEAERARDTFIGLYPGLLNLKEHVIPRDVRRGYFVGLDKRRVVCKSDHLMLAGYLQNGEAVIMKYACLDWYKKLTDDKVPFKLVNDVHDEWQTEVPNDKETIEHVQQTQIQSIRDTGVRFNLNLPLDGESKVGNNWYETH